MVLSIEIRQFKQIETEISNFAGKSFGAIPKNGVA
jgi:hypothetical protein